MIDRAPRRLIGHTRPLVVAVAVLILSSLAAASWLGMREIRLQRAVYGEVLTQRLRSTQRDFRLLLKPFARGLQTLAAWREAGLLPQDDGDALAALVVPLVDPAPQVAVVAVVPEDSAATLLVRGTDGWRTIRGDTAEAVRTAPWCATATDSTAWSDFGLLPGDGRPGLMATRRAAGTVFALGLPERDIDAFVAAAPLTENGILMRRFGDGSVAWFTAQAGDRLTVTAAAELMTSAAPEHAVMGAALRAWGEAGRPYSEPLRFQAAGTTWWVVFYPRVAGTDPGELGLIAPASDLERHLATASDRMLGLLVGVALLAVVAILLQAFAYRSRWRRVARRRLDVPTDEAGLAALVAGGESERLEFKSTMRWNLRADKPGKEIELAWLKTVVAYLNTDGGILLFGVRDDGTVLGVDADGFRNEDTYRLHFENLIKQHVGLEFAGRIRGGFRDLAAGKVFLVAVERGDEPAFLRHGDDEEFYVRVGPSSRRLPASRVLDYSRERQR